jgi:hypothetical protein
MLLMVQPSASKIERGLWRNGTFELWCYAWPIIFLIYVHKNREAPIHDHRIPPCHRRSSHLPYGPCPMVNPDIGCLMVERGHRRIVLFHYHPRLMAMAEATSLLTAGKRHRGQRPVQGRK